MKQLIAENKTTGIKIIERYLDGIKYLKVIPKNVMPVILNGLKTQFKDNPVEIKSSEGGWVSIERTGDMEKLRKAGENMIEQVGEDTPGLNVVDEDYILEKEAEILRKQGFEVRIENVKDG